MSAKAVPAKDDRWLSARDLRDQVPGDCEKVSDRLFARLVELSKGAKAVKVQGVVVKVEERMVGNRIEPCIPRESLQPFFGAVRQARQVQVEKVAKRAMDEAMDESYAPRF